MSETYLNDTSFKYPIQVSSIPSTVDLYSFTSGTLPANTALIITWTTTPATPQLSLWNFHWSVRLGADNANNNWPDGTSLTANQANTEINMHTSALLSNDRTNVRKNKLVMKNSSADSFGYYNYFKSYSFAPSVGSTA